MYFKRRLILKEKPDIQLMDISNDKDLFINVIIKFIIYHIN